MLKYDECHYPVIQLKGFVSDDYNVTEKMKWKRRIVAYIFLVEPDSRYYFTYPVRYSYTFQLNGQRIKNYKFHIPQDFILAFGTRIGLLLTSNYQRVDNDKL